jgi:hypothetical protein
LLPFGANEQHQLNVLFVPVFLGEVHLRSRMHIFFVFFIARFQQQLRAIFGLLFSSKM